MPSSDPRAALRFSDCAWIAGISLELLPCLLNQEHLFRVVNFLQQEFNPLFAACMHPPSHESRLNWQLAVAAIDQHAQLNLCRPAIPKKGFQGCACRAP